ncbi:MAG: TIM barrel protein [Chloroflexi bacterium]|nr:TIM barrel protein [Chloroflexota bacterium]
MRYAANLTMLWTEVDEYRRFERAAAAGFRAVEMLFPFHFDLDRIGAELERNGLALILFDTDPGDFAAGDRGYLNDPAQQGRFEESVVEAIEIARRFETPMLNALCGRDLPVVSRERQRATVVENLGRAAALCERAGITLLIEVLNTVDTPGYFLDSLRLGLDVIAEVRSPALRFQFDVYHLQIMEGDLVRKLTRHVEQIGHIQIADVPDRNEPGTGEINYPFVLGRLEQAGYGGYVGLEYRPRTTTEESLQWLPRERRG